MILIILWILFIAIISIPLYLLALVGYMVEYLGRLLQRPFNFISLWVAILDRQHK